MPDYTVTSAIQSGQRYEPGETITLTTKEAKELAALGAIDPKPLKAAKAAKADKTDKTGDKGKDPEKTGNAEGSTSP